MKYIAYCQKFWQGKIWGNAGAGGLEPPGLLLERSRLPVNGRPFIYLVSISNLSLRSHIVAVAILIAKIATLTLVMTERVGIRV